MKKEFLIEKQGKTFCLYVGLLDAAHDKGLVSIITSLIQIPHETNGRTAICSATVKLLDDKGIEREFTGIGDASPNNLPPAMQTCSIRMAETRAKARALRDAINAGVTAFEELGNDEEAPARSYRQPAQMRNHDAEPMSSLNDIGDKCPDCYAPDGKPHARTCKLSGVAAILR